MDLARKNQVVAGEMVIMGLVLLEAVVLGSVALLLLKLTRILPHQALQHDC